MGTSHLDWPLVTLSPPPLPKVFPKWGGKKKDIGSIQIEIGTYITICLVSSTMKINWLIASSASSKFKPGRGKIGTVLLSTQGIIKIRAHKVRVEHNQILVMLSLVGFMRHTNLCNLERVGDLHFQ